MILTDPMDSVALCNISRYKINDISDAQMDTALDMAIKAKSQWVSIHHTPHRPSELPRIIVFIKRAKLKNLKVHFRCHYTKDYGNHEFNFQTGVATKTLAKATGGTDRTLIDTTKNWEIDQWKGFNCTIDSGTNKGQAMYITSNTSNTLYLIEAGDNYKVFTAPIDSTSMYKITYKEPNDNAFTSTSFGWYKYVKDAAIAAKNAGADSLSVCNEITNTIITGITGSIFENGSLVVKAQKDLVAYIKAQGITFVEGITTSDGFWMHSDWIASGSIAPLDYLGYTAYEEESRFFHTVKRLADTFGADKIQLDEMSLSDDYTKMKRRGIFTADIEYSRRLSNRIKYCKFLGIKNVFRFELADDGNDNGLRPGFGYGRFQNYNVSNIIYDSWVPDSYNKIIDPRITNFSLGFRQDIKALQINNNSTLDLQNKLTIQFWTHIATSDTSTTPTFVGKNNSYLLRIENKRLTATVWTSNGQYKIQDDYDFITDYIYDELGVRQYGNDLKNNGTIPHDRWVHIAYVYDGSKQSLYVNGKSVASGSVSGNIINNSSLLSIGGEANNASESIDGRIQDVEIIKDVVYTANFNPSRLKPATPNTVVRLIMDEGIGTLVKDTSGNNNNFTILGTGLSKASWFIGLRDKLYYQEIRYAIKGLVKNYAIKNGTKSFVIKPTV
jgi:Concanavalin A-like lectin/glucanases superfamily